METQIVIARRRPRVWAPTQDSVHQLSRSARQLARSSASRIARPAVARCLEKLKLAMAMERALKLKIADLIVELVDGHGLRAIDVARETGWRPGDISQMYATARAFSPRRRPRGARYNHLMLAMRMTRKFPQLWMTPAKAYRQIISAGLTQHRDVGRLFAELAQNAENRAARKTRLLIDQRRTMGLLNQTHHSRFQDLRDRFADGSVKFIHVDPVYLYPRGTYRSRSARSRACDGADRASAIATVIDLLRDWQAVLAPRGVLGIWQPWNSLLAEYQQAAEKHRWRVVGPIVWDKIRPQPGDLGSPFAPHGEMLWLFHRPGEKLVNHDRSSREMILRIPPVSFPTLSNGQLHTYQKPQKLLEKLVRKLTRPGEVVADLCGCTGSMSLAAINADRQFVYIESNAKNYGVGSARIAAALVSRQTMAS